MFCNSALRSQVQTMPVMCSVEYLLGLTMFCNSALRSQVQTIPGMCSVEYLLRLTMFCKSALRSQVRKTLVMYHDYIGTLTEVDCFTRMC